MREAGGRRTQRQELSASGVLGTLLESITRFELLAWLSPFASLAPLR